MTRLKRIIEVAFNVTQINPGERRPCEQFGQAVSPRSKFYGSGEDASQGGAETAMGRSGLIALGEAGYTLFCVLAQQDSEPGVA